MSELPRLRSANDAYASGFAKGDLPVSPARRLAIVACMDARLDPARAFGLEEGDAHVIRNAGGVVTDDVVRSLIASHHLLGTREVVVVRHTQCGMMGLENDHARTMVSERSGADASGIDFLPFADLDESVRNDVAKLRASPFLREAAVSGFVFDVSTGRLRQVE